MSVVKGPGVKVAIQVLLVAIMSIIGTYISEILSYRGYLNLLALLSNAAIISYFFNDSWMKKIVMFAVLGVFSFLIIGTTGYILGYAD
jgi:hypothetical protein